MKKRYLSILLVLALVLALCIVAACKPDCATDGHKWGDDGKCTVCGEAKPADTPNGDDPNGDDPNAISATLMQELYDGMDTVLKGTKAIQQGGFSLPAITTTFDDEGNTIEALIQWTATGSDDVTVGDRDEDDYCAIQCPAIREEAIVITLTGTLTDENGVAYKKANGDAYSTSKDIKILSADSLKAAVDSFYDAAVKTPQVGVAYKWAAIAQYQVYYFKGNAVTSPTHGYGTTLNYSESPDVFLEANDDGTGYYVYFMNGTTKTYVDMTIYKGDGYQAPSTDLVTDKANLQGTYTVHSTGALVATVKGDASGSAAKGYNLGVREQYIPAIGAINNYLDTETGNHGWKTYEHPLFLLESEYTLPAQPSLTPDQIVDKANALEEGEMMSGRWTLEGTVTEASGNVDFRTATIRIESGKTIIAYGMFTGKTGTSDVQVGAVIRVTGVIKNYGGTVEFDKYCQRQLVKAAQDPTHAGTAGDPYDVADAKIIASVMATDQFTDEMVYITGKVSGAPTVSNGEYKFDIVTNVGDENKVIVYWTTSAQAPQDGDTVVIKGYLTVYGGAPELAKKDNSTKPVIVSINGVSIIEEDSSAD